MTNSWNGPQLGSPIRTDVPELQKKLIALLKQDPTSVADIPSGAKRLVNTSGVQWQVQQYNGSSWAAIGKLMHDVDKLDGYHAAITPNANTVAVRNADKKLEGDITGNAATASSATTLSETLPVNKGGTGATTSAAARTNLGVPPTSHASSSTTYGLGSNANYGHVRGDGVTTNVVSGEVVAKDIALGGDSADPATGRGFFYDTYAPEYNGEAVFITDFDQLTIPGNYHIRFSNTTLNAPDGVIYNNSGNNDGYIEIFKISSASTISSYSRIGQRLTVFGIKGFATERVQGGSSTGAFNPWRRLIDDGDVATASVAGIMKPGDGLSASSGGIVGLDDTVLRTSGNQYASGQKISKSQDGWVIQRDNAERGNSEKNNTGGTFCVYDKNKKYIGAIDIWMKNGDTSMSLYTLNGMDAEDTTRSGITIYFKKDGTRYVACPTPPSTSNSNTIATTAWVRKYTLPTGALIPSLATSMTGYLLCNGAAVSRTTYADLFGVIGTKFGTGDGSKTFNLPDFRDKTLWGANGNLMAILAAGLPNATGSVTAMADRTRWVSFRDFSSAIQAAGSNNPAVSDEYYTHYIGGYNGFTVDLSKSNSIYGNSTTVQPPAIAVNIFIKY